MSLLCTRKLNMKQRIRRVNESTENGYYNEKKMARPKHEFLRLQYITLEKYTVCALCFVVVRQSQHKLYMFHAMHCIFEIAS